MTELNKWAALLALCSMAASSSLTGCAMGEATRTSATVYQPTDASQVQVLFEKPSRPYEVIGTVRTFRDTMSFAPDASLFKVAQEKAAKLGAHAIIMDGYGSHSSVGSPAGEMHALAIRFTK